MLATLVVVLLGVCPVSTSAEIWSYACAESMTLLKQAQEDVSQKHDHFYQAKLVLKLFPDGLDTCQSSRRGFAGGRVHCVNHRSHGGVAIKEVMRAEQVLSHAIQHFEHRVKEFQHTCSSIR